MKRLLIIICILLLLISSLIIAPLNVRRRNIEAKKTLNHIYELEDAYKSIFGHYADNLYTLVFIQDTLVTEGGKANYKVSLLKATDSTFVATAVSVVDFDRDGQFNTWTVNETGIITEIVKD